MVLFFTENIQGDTAVFGEEESKHIKNSLRKSAGEDIHFVDGKGHKYVGTIVESQKKSTIVKIHSKTLVEVLHPHIEIAIAPTKSIDRIEWFLEKSIELGISEVSFILCKHSERKVIKMDRMERIAIAATKQSLKAQVPRLNPLQNIEDWLAEDFDGDSYIACLIDETVPMASVLKSAKNVRIAIGPEGGFRQSEIDFAVEKGFQAVSLGSQRLRTETAGLYSVAHVHLLGESPKKN